MYSDPNSVKRISSLGAGPIGGGWTAHFLARGYDVTAYLHDNSETNSFMSILKTAWISLSELGLAPSASMDIRTRQYRYIRYMYMQGRIRSC